MSPCLSRMCLPIQSGMTNLGTWDANEMVVGALGLWTCFPGLQGMEELVEPRG